MKIFNIPRVLIAGDRSSSGKTTLCIGLMASLRKRGLEVQGFKVGLDYIDPGFHTLVSGRPSRNLDGFLMAPDTIKEIFIRGCEGADIAVIEGVRGLYEGLNYFDDVGSTAEIAKILDCPVILVVDASSITRSVAAVVNGYKSFDPGIEISGVILNRIGSERHGEKAEKAVEEYCGVKVIGKIPNSRDLEISMRHLGLITANECQKRGVDFSSVLEEIKQSVEEGVNFDLFFNVARSANARGIKEQESRIFSRKMNTDAGKAVKVAIAFDEVFNFYYQDTLDLLRLEGAEIVYFSPISDKKLPDGVDAVYIGGGFPELYGEELSLNKSMCKSIKDFYDGYGLLYAECGGLMYLMEELEYKGESFDMCGVIKGSVRMEGKRVINYVEGEFRKDCILGEKGCRFRGHEFHHSKILLNEGVDDDVDVDFAYKMLRGVGIKDGMDGWFSKNCLASFTHLHGASYTGLAENFVRSARKSFS